MSKENYTKCQKYDIIGQHNISSESGSMRFEKGKVDTVANWRVFRMKPPDAEEPGEIDQMKFFVNQDGMVEQIYLIENNGRKVVWDAGEDWDYPDISEPRLYKAFYQFALGNPKDFQKMYRILLFNKQKRLWQCMQNTRAEILQIFNFQ